MVFYLFFISGRASLSQFFLTKFRCHQDKKKVIEPVRIACFWRGEKIFQFLRVFRKVLVRVLNSFIVYTKLVSTKSIVRLMIISAHFSSKESNSSTSPSAYTPIIGDPDVK